MAAITRFSARAENRDKITRFKVLRAPLTLIIDIFSTFDDLVAILAPLGATFVGFQR